jgi:hypothetical protein
VLGLGSRFDGGGGENEEKEGDSVAPRRLEGTDRRGLILGILVEGFVSKCCRARWESGTSVNEAFHSTVTSVGDGMGGGGGGGDAWAVYSINGVTVGVVSNVVLMGYELSGLVLL